MLKGLFRWDIPFPRTGCNLDCTSYYINFHFDCTSLVSQPRCLSGCAPKEAVSGATAWLCCVTPRINPSIRPEHRLPVRAPIGTITMCFRFVLLGGLDSSECG